MESDVAVVLQQVHVESECWMVRETKRQRDRPSPVNHPLKSDCLPLALLLRSTIDDESLSRDESIRSNSTLIRNRVVLSSPLDMIQHDVSVNGEMSHTLERDTMIEGLDLLLKKALR